MLVRQPRYSKEEAARRGTEIYERDVRPLVEADNKGKIVFGSFIIQQSALRLLLITDWMRGRCSKTVLQAHGTLALQLIILSLPQQLFSVLFQVSSEAEK